MGMRTGLDNVDDECLNVVLDIISDGVWDWHVNADYVYRSPGWYRMLGYEAGTLPTVILTWEQSIHPDDHERVSKHFDDYIHNRSSLYCIEYRVRKLDNSYLWIKERAKIVAWNE